MHPDPDKEAVEAYVARLKGDPHFQATMRKAVRSAKRLDRYSWLWYTRKCGCQKWFWGKRVAYCLEHFATSFG